MRYLQVLWVSVPASQKGLHSGHHGWLVMSEMQSVWPASVGAASSPALNSNAKQIQELYYFHFCCQGNWLWARKYLLPRPHSLNVVDLLPSQTSCTLTVVLLLKPWPRKWLEPPWNGGSISAPGRSSRPLWSHQMNLTHNKAWDVCAYIRLGCIGPVCSVSHIIYTIPMFLPGARENFLQMLLMMVFLSKRTATPLSVCSGFRGNAWKCVGFVFLLK